MTNNLDNRAFVIMHCWIEDIILFRPETPNYYDLTNIIICWDHQPRLLCSIFVEDIPLKDLKLTCVLLEEMSYVNLRCIGIGITNITYN